MSRQPRPPPQARGIAPSSAGRGSGTKMATRVFSPPPIGSGWRSGIGPGLRVSGAVVVMASSLGVAVPARTSVVAGWALLARTGARVPAEYAYVTVGYATVGCARGKRIFAKILLKITPARCWYPQIRYIST